jgi:hypothetical protein
MEEKKIVQEFLQNIFTTEEMEIINLLQEEDSEQIVEQLIGGGECK